MLRFYIINSMTTKKLDWLEVFDKDELVEFLSELIPLCEYLPKYEEGSEFEFDCMTTDVTEHPCYPLSRMVHEWYETYIALTSDEFKKAFSDIVITNSELTDSSNSVKDYKVFTSSGNVFADLGYPDAEERLERVKRDAHINSQIKILDEYLIADFSDNEEIMEAHEFAELCWESSKNDPKLSKIAIKANRLLGVVKPYINSTAYLRWFYCAYQDIY